MIYIGIVGSRKRTEKFDIFNKLTWYLGKYLSKGICLVSGGAEGIDTEAEQIAKELGIKTQIFKPKLHLYKLKGNDIYYERNLLIAKLSDYLIAYPLNREGGTMNTIGHFIDLGKQDNLTIID